MSAPVYIDVNAFMQKLHEDGLVIVHRSQLLVDAEMERKELLKRRELTLKEIVQAGFFPTINDSETLRRWCLDGKIKGWRKSGKRYYVLCSEIKRMVYGE